MLDGQDLTEVENGLFPVRVLGVRTGAESNWLVTGGEVDVEPSNQRMYKIVAAAVEHKGRRESEICGGASVEVEGKDGGWVGDNGFDFDGVDERFGEGGVLEG